MNATVDPEVIPQERSPSGTQEAFAANVSGAASDEPGIRLLSSAVFRAAMHGPDEGQAFPPLQAETLLQLERVQKWIEDPGASSSLVWSGGPPGVGQSVTVQQIIDVCHASNRVAASFFFHTGEGNEQGQALFTTIAYQLANNIAPLRAPINRIVSANPSVLDKPLAAQFQSLVVQPFRDPGVLHLPSFIVVIDGLDEYAGKNFQMQIIDLIDNSVAISNIPLRFLFSSRPEPHKQDESNTESQIHSAERLSLAGISLGDAVSTISQPVKSRSGSSSQPLLHLQRWFSPGSYKRLVMGNKRASSLDSFPKLVTVQAGNGSAESYARSLMMTGNGFPLWYPGGDLGKPIKYLQRGISIGDVGTLDRDGLFDFCFNIFRSPDDPIHSGLVPREFRPLEPGLDSSEVKTIPEYFTPGEVITSQGVDVAKNKDDPLKCMFSSLDPTREGGILVLPHGASREDLIHTERIHEYAKRNAPYWYQDVNGYGGIVHTNGSLFLVTGCDKTNDWALASFPYYPGAKGRLDLQYNWQPDYISPWIDHGTARTSYYAPPTSRPIPVEPGTRHQCIFVRGMRISLSAKSWRETMPASESARLYYTFILRTPSSLELLMNSILIHLRLRMSERQAMKTVTPSRLELFHPNFVIGQVLLQQYPKSEVALVDDSVWCSLTHKSICTMAEINSLVTAVFDRNNVLVQNGVVSLVSKTEDEYATHTRPPDPVSRPLWSTFPVLPKFLKQNPEKKDRHWIQDIPVSEHAKLF